MFFFDTAAAFIPVYYFLRWTIRVAFKVDMNYFHSWIMNSRNQKLSYIENGIQKVSFGNFSAINISFAKHICRFAQRKQQSSQDVRQEGRKHCLTVNCSHATKISHFWLFTQKRTRIQVTMGPETVRRVNKKYSHPRHATRRLTVTHLSTVTTVCN